MNRAKASTRRGTWASPFQTRITLPQPALLGAACLTLLFSACRAPTEVSLQLTTDADCRDVVGTSITIGRLVELESRPPTTATAYCDRASNRIGSLVVVPSQGKDDEFAVRIVTGFNKAPEQCVADGYVGGCIVARRALKFIPHETIVLPIAMEAACVDVPCGTTETCRKGQCVSATLTDPQRCTDPNGCESTMVSSGGSGGHPASSGGAKAESGGAKAESGGAETESGGMPSMSGTGGLAWGGTSGAPSSGSAAGSLIEGGATGTGGDASGSRGSNTGGSNTGGSSTGGSSTGGSSTGSSNTGGSSTGSSNTGGSSTGAEAGTGGSAGIDATEVTRAAYAEWLASDPVTTNQIAVCSWNNDFTPTCGWPPGSLGNHPVSCVDWCDAYAYCASIHRRLCGKIGGGPNPFNEFANAASSQWFAACTSGLANTYPYGSTYGAQICNGAGNTSITGDTAPVASLPNCHSSVPGFTGLYDMSGNVAEWEDSCSGTDGAYDACRFRGGDWSSAKTELTCAVNAFTSRSNAYFGIRCCSSP